MSHEKATEANGHTNSACWHYWQAAWSMAIPRPITFLAAFISLSGLLGIGVRLSTDAIGRPQPRWQWLDCFHPDADHQWHLRDGIGERHLHLLCF